MDNLRSLEFSIFVMIATGFLLRKVKALGKEAERVITDLVLYLVLPAISSIPFWATAAMRRRWITLFTVNMVMAA